MNNEVDSTEFNCPYCGAVNTRWDEKCWLCKQPLRADAVATAPVVAELVDVKPQFGLATLMLVITVVCLCLGLVAIAPGLIVPLVIFVVPALIRTTVATKVAGEPITVANKIASFFLSLGLVVLIWFAGLFAFGVVCTLLVIGATANNANDRIMPFLMMLGIGAIIGAISLMGWLLYLTWPSRKKK